MVDRVDVGGLTTTQSGQPSTPPTTAPARAPPSTYGVDELRAEGNARAKALFDEWLVPLRDLGAGINVEEGIGSTDHVPFKEIGLPAFNAIKDFEAYDERTRHTNADFPERMSAEELRQQAVVMATFAWRAAMMEGRVGR